MITAVIIAGISHLYLYLVPTVINLICPRFYPSGQGCILFCGFSASSGDYKKFIRLDGFVQYRKRQHQDGILSDCYQSHIQADIPQSAGQGGFKIFHFRNRM